MNPPSPRLSSATAIGMALVGGYVDVVGFVLLFGLFVNHATGNLVMLGVSLAGGGQGIATKLLSLPVFIVAAAATYVMICKRRAWGQDNEAAVLLLQAAILLVFMLLTIAALPAKNADQPAVMLAGLVGVCAMAVQNVGARVVFSHMAPTTIMTGNVTQIAIDLVDLLSSKTGLDQALRARIAKTWPPVLAFAVGAIGGAVGVLAAGAWSLLPAVVVVAILGGLYARAPHAEQA